MTPRRFDFPETMTVEQAEALLARIEAYQRQRAEGVVTVIVVIAVALVVLLSWQ